MTILFKGHKISDEQNDALSLFKKMKNGDVLTINAGAGASKTYTCNLLISMGAPNYQKALVLAFNRLIVEEMRSAFSNNVTIVTTHELARMHTKNFANHRLETPLTPSHVISAFNLPMNIGELSSRSFVHKLIKLIKQFASSSQLSVEAYIETEGANYMSPSERKQLPTFVYYARKLWDEMINRKSSIPVMHDVYLKEFVQRIVSGELVLDYDIIVLDEAQDSAPIVKLLFEALAGKKIAVGDTFQSIYEWRMAVNVMETLSKTSSHNAQLTTCYRFGKDIANLANALIGRFHKRQTEFQGNPSKKSVIVDSARQRKVNTTELWLFRTNAELMGELMSAHKAGIKCELLKDNKEYLKLIDEAEALFNCNRKHNGILAPFIDWQDFENYAMSEAGGEFKSFVNAVMRYGFKELREVVQSSMTVKNSKSERQFATAHACKGIEADNVILYSDFDKVIQKMTGKALIQEANLLYVALTRAKTYLDISRCKTLIDIIKHNDETINKRVMTDKRNKLAELGLI
ncbi:UvrD-helicase domain-containing protein [Vibrio vulnificus]|uniref:UvrD-helicase domain-containing protein n=1 Tax=Vibrio vulnificus TaxID=672 RepID=UPI001A352D89|nr:AAA family ATPase [Vibrio vulnificus]HAS6415217.1 AAA family ATPase [Vibrio vulnificus]HDY7429186.1 ATP-dependent helicase [Vibrio vulnificus]HDY7488726.1 ATP-dependent helicase [Vibrio vulnificus]HDY7951615.1 ATP-dependent helicase [Vibrio vulnificus]